MYMKLVYTFPLSQITGPKMTTKAQSDSFQIFEEPLFRYLWLSAPLTATFLAFVIGYLKFSSSQVDRCACLKWLLIRVYGVRVGKTSLDFVLFFLFLFLTFFFILVLIHSLSDIISTWLCGKSFVLFMMFCFLLMYNQVLNSVLSLKCAWVFWDFHLCSIYYLIKNTDGKYVFNTDRWSIVDRFDL